MTSPGLPLVNQCGINPEPDMWAFQIETPDASVTTADAPSIMIDYVHPGTLHDYTIDDSKERVYFPTCCQHLCRLLALADWDTVFHDESWRHFPKSPNPESR